jgi:hypothetical protein
VFLLYPRRLRTARAVLPFAIVLCLALIGERSLLAGVIVVDFESFNDSDLITTQIPGLTFTNAIAFTAGISLNEFEFPPHSGNTVASDFSGPIAVAFSAPVFSVGGYFTYEEPLSLTAFDASDNPVASASSLYSNNDAFFGDPGSVPNELIDVSFPGGISSVTATADPNGGSFTLDDFTVETTATSTPEPDCGLLCLAGFGAFLRIHRCFTRGQPSCAR